jgi:hypothetical protein
MTYLRLAIVAAFLGVCALAFWYRGNAIDAEAAAEMTRRDLSTAVVANEAFKDQVADLEAHRKRNDEITLGLAEKLAEIRTGYVQAVKDVADLRGNDNAVADYLNLDVPPALTGVLDRRAPGRSAAGQVRP